GVPQLLDPLELPGSGDDGASPDGVLADLQLRFRASAWWGLNPLAIEVPFEREVEGLVVRGRMDAVYRHPDGDEVVDWKTGTPPAGAAAKAAAVQLAVYRLAWSELAGVPLAAVRATFHYVSTGETVRPVDLLDDDGLRALIRSIPTES
ncbi:MAG: UvrD/REP helicase, partial [Frankiales bacterium]|nr:UvrD/REP helicase [Frankiales bacterium]